MAAIVILPALGSWFYYAIHSGKPWAQTSFRPGFFDYPMTEIDQYNVKSNYHSTVAIVILCIAFLLVSILYFYPRLFGFKKVPIEIKTVNKAPYPWWGWFGLIIYLGSEYLLWRSRTVPYETELPHPEWLYHWSDIPLFWGLALLIDGFVYRRSGGKSLVRNYPFEVVGIGVASMGGWMLFEYLNMFVKDNWYYPCGHIIGDQQFLLYAIVISSGLLPIAFMFYTWFNTFPNLKVKYNNGIKITFPGWLKNALIVISLVGLVSAGLFPNFLFFSLWITPALLVALALDKLGIWSPFKFIGEGNWSPVLLFALTYLATGLFLEGENYFQASQTVNPDGALTVITHQPAFWKYDLPFINDTPHLFEMPLLGFLGYLPFGVYCWLWWIMWATLLNVKSRFFQIDPLSDTPDKV